MYVESTKNYLLYLTEEELKWIYDLIDRSRPREGFSNDKKTRLSFLNTISAVISTKRGFAEPHQI